ncbi:HEAT repeat domain-containing protein [Actinacidiphila acidipaludis]|uniref:HEAT repeat domain-containing protein n=1 Tax=Actinacidiphila acidipaludis TaxID=2873382 RepID=A0ABS7PZ64_9ACTN|nr:HEAT repeat domain-containing protein [Streptomyces acidipaludis]MBY8876189.1 HEAT repeat domain-containing protein [Streptomyces acidipaludis]
MPMDAAALIAAVRAGDTDAAEELLAAGVPADARDDGGYTALGLAVVRADAAMCEVLLRAGADPNLRCPGGRTPVMLAADGGAVGAWHELRGGSPDFWFRDDVGRDAMDLARAWVGVDAGAELLRRLGGVEGDEARITRGPAQDVGTGWFETVHVTTSSSSSSSSTQSSPSCSVSVQTGHAAILTELEELRGIRVPYGELADRAVAFEPDHVGRFYPAMALASRMDEETFTVAAAELTSASDAARRRFAAEVLVLHAVSEDEPAVRLHQAAIDLLRRRAAVEEDPGVLTEILRALGLHDDTRALPQILRHAGHPEPEVRAQAAASLHGMVVPDNPEALRTVLTLTEDADAQVRRNAASTLSDVRADTPRIRASLARLMDDADPDVSVEGARGLGLRDDPRADLPVVRAFLDRPEDSVPEAHRAYEVIRRMPRERFLAARDAIEGRDSAATDQP